MKLNIKTTAIVHSLNSSAQVVIKEKIGDNQYLADYEGMTCTAMFNPFTSSFYVDDIYGVLPPFPEDQWERAIQEMRYLCESNQRELEAYRKLGSVASLKALKREDAIRNKQRNKLRESLFNAIIGAFTLVSVWGIIYYIAVIV